MVWMFLAAAAGGALGAVARYAAYRTIDADFPWTTFIVNIIGCTVASFLMFRYGMDMGDTLKTMVFVGFFGAFTTMSTFSIDTINLVADGSYWLAAGNVVLNSAVCIAGAAVGRCLATIRAPSRRLYHEPEAERYLVAVVLMELDTLHAVPMPGAGGVGAVAVGIEIRCHGCESQYDVIILAETASPLF